MREVFNAITSSIKDQVENLQLRKAARKIGRFYTAPDASGNVPTEDVFITETISYESLPREVKWAIYRNNPDTREVRMITEPTGLKTYIVLDEWGHQGSRTSTAVYAFDFFQGKEICYSYFQHSTPSGTVSEDTKGVTFQGKTMKGFDRRGLGERRLIILDEFSQDRWGVPVNSTLDPSRSAEATWKKLVRRKLVTFDETQGIYRFFRRQTRTDGI